MFEDDSIDNDEMFGYLYYWGNANSTEKYGGYNGFSNDSIETTFGANPKKTWNVDQAKLSIMGNNSIQEYKLDTAVYFGKYSCYTIREIYQYDPSYLDWCLININNFYIDIELFKKLPYPTPMRLLKLKINSKIQWFGGTLGPTDNYIKSAQEYLNEGNFLEKKDFKFSENAVNAFKVKKSLL